MDALDLEACWEKMYVATYKMRGQSTSIAISGVDIALHDWIGKRLGAPWHRIWGLDPAKTNPNGGAIAMGHPLGATGAVRTATIVHGLRRRQQKYGMVTMCIGTGMGAAGVFERV